MDSDLKILYGVAMSSLMETEAKTFGSFFTQEEFERNQGKIFKITKANRKLENKLKIIC